MRMGMSNDPKQNRRACVALQNKNMVSDPQGGSVGSFGT